MTTTRTAALLIDWENLFLGREKTQNRDGDWFDCADDVDSLVRYVEQAAAEYGCDRLGIKRAYADFQARRKSADPRRTFDYYLQRTPFALMESGIEPVQVFRNSRNQSGESKNACDMRMTVDALELAAGPGGLDTLFLASGDSDFVPLATTLRRRGSRVVAIAVEDTASAVLRKFVDAFVSFEELVVAVQPGVKSDHLLDAYRKVLYESLSGLPNAGVTDARKALAQAGLPVDLEELGCSSFEHFLRKYSEELAVLLEGTPESGYAVSIRPKTSSDPDGTQPGTDLHNVRVYERVLTDEWPRLYIITSEEWNEFTARLLRYFRNTKDPIASEELADVLANAQSDSAVEVSERTLQRALFQCVAARVLVRPEPNGNRRVPGKKEPVVLEPDAASADEVNARVRRYLADTLRTRLRSMTGDSSLDTSEDVLRHLLDR